MSYIIENTQIWNKTLKSYEMDKNNKERERLRSCFVSFRENVSILSNEINRSLPEFTVHDISHLDALWEMADTIIGKDYNLTPTEAFVLGGAILLHDLGMSISAYPKGLNDIKQDSAWKDIVTSLYLSKLNKAPNECEIINPLNEILEIAISNILRKRHAEQAEKLATIYWNNPSNNNQIFLINDPEIRQTFGRIIGKIANSHWWDIKKLEIEFSRIIGAPAWCPGEWTIDPLKIACILRVADASHIDARRAPMFLRTLRKLNFSSDIHWGFQEKLQKPYLREDSLNYSSGYAFSYSEASQWWLCYETLNLINKELNQVDTLLADKNLPRFAAKRVFGVESPERLLSLIPVDGWFPFDATVHIGDIPKIIKTLGGQELYGENFSVPIRELIQNSSDAIRARRLIENRDEDWGEIIISFNRDDENSWIQIEDNGIGMSINVIKDYLLNFGCSYWESDLIKDEYPGLISSGIKQTGKYGIGFFSLFMISNKFQVITKQITAAQTDTYVLEFNNGLNIRPIIRKANNSEYLRDGGTKIKIWIKNNSIENKLFINRTDKIISLSSLCLSIAPSLDCKLTILDNKEKKSFEANYWLKCSNDEFLKLLLSDQIEDIDLDIDSCDVKDYLNMLKNNFEILADTSGEVYGRACITNDVFFSQSNLFLNGLLTIGGLTASNLNGIFGILKGNTITASRDHSEPSVPKNVIANWASSQAHLLKNICTDNKALLDCSQLVRILGGNVNDLVIAKHHDKWFTLDELIIFLKGVNEIFILDYWFIESKAKYMKNLKFIKNIIITNSSSSPGIIMDSNAHSFFSNNNDNWLYSYTNFGLIIDAISTAWMIDLNSLKNSSFIKEIKRESVCIAKSDEQEIFESVFILSREFLNNL